MAWWFSFALLFTVCRGCHDPSSVFHHNALFSFNLNAFFNFTLISNSENLQANTTVLCLMFLLMCLTLNGSLHGNRYLQIKQNIELCRL